MTELNDLARWWQLHVDELDAVRARLWQLAGQLDGGLTAGQATSSWDVRIAFALKYELKDGLLDQLEGFLHGPLADQRAGPDGLVARDRLIELIAHLAANGMHLSRRTYGDSSEVTRTLRMVRGCADALETLATRTRDAVLTALR
jgi:hypothetical protein